MPEIPDDVYEQIKRLCAEGDILSNSGRFPEALKKYWVAWDLVPDPKNGWDASTWILGAIGDANYLGGDFQTGIDNLSLAMSCPNGIGNPFLHLRLGQCQLEMANKDKAVDELLRAYMAEGFNIFEGEDPKYYDFLKSSVKAPIMGWES